ncbi:MAG: hypothetical protein DIZ80_12195 [endosymbiont of Galathealinum brachiosum]|uniref:DUF481 domain-containing protein n=1 Tax=endosymbiont of Galathealinum brachiosum TaxID=2200906 RepID=A0A370DFT6_9GAMM|nr:MAG: hypothetical protein DIZ80_12195 [endosymbiont of Galathealinum brachiosum]
MLNNKIFSLLLLSAVASSTVCAGEWTGEGEFGFTSTSGNTDSKNLNAKLGIGKKHDKWEHNAKLELLKASADGADSADSMVLTEKSEYRFVEKTFAYGKLRHEEDEFSGFDHQSVISFGAGHVFIDGGKHNLEGSVGIGYRDLETDAGTEEQEAIIDGELKYAYKISETSEFNQNFYIESGDSNTYSKSETFLKLVIVGNLGAKFGYEVKRNSDVPVGTDKTDTITTVTLVYTF